MDLNNDCLCEVFEQLKQAKLPAIADVCGRYRTVAQEHFRTSKCKRVTFWKNDDDEDDDFDFFQALLKGIPTMMRNFV